MKGTGGDGRICRRSTDCKLRDDGLVKPKHVGAFSVYFNLLAPEIYF
jgi:hypothetical protein